MNMPIQREKDDIVITAVNGEGAETLAELDDEMMFRISHYPRAFRAGLDVGMVSLGPARLDGRDVIVFGVRDPEQDPDDVNGIPLFVLVDEKLEVAMFGRGGDGEGSGEPDASAQG